MTPTDLLHRLSGLLGLGGRNLRRHHASATGHDVIAAFELFVDRAPSRCRHGHPVSVKTIQHYRHALSYLRAFVEENRTAPLTFADLDRDFYERYVSFAYHRHLRLNTIGNHIKTLKALVRSQPQIIQNLAWEFMRCEGLREETDAVVLTEQELRHIAVFPLQSPLLVRVRDLYIIMCWTGVRYSDLWQLTRDNIITDAKGNAYFSFRAAKTGRKSLVRIFPEVEAVLKKYDGGRSLPRIPSNTRFNRRLAQMLELMAATPRLASLNEPITRTYTGLRPDGTIGYVRQTLPRWQLTRCHTARRTFATNMRLRGNDRDVICAATGHRTEAALSRYIKDTLLDRASRLH